MISVASLKSIFTSEICKAATFTKQYVVTEVSKDGDVLGTVCQFLCALILKPTLR